MSGRHFDAATGCFESIGIGRKASELLLLQPMQFVARSFRSSARRKVFPQDGLELTPCGNGRGQEQLARLSTGARPLHVLFPRDPPSQGFISEKLLCERDLSRFWHMRVTVFEEDVELIDPVDHSVAVLAVEHTGLAEQPVESEVGVVALRTCGLRRGTH